MSSTEEAARQLIVAIEELVRFAKTCSAQAPADIERFDARDGRVYGLALAAGLTIPVGKTDPNGSYGHTRILTWASPRGRYIVPTDDWQGRMRQLRSAAEAMDGIRRPLAKGRSANSEITESPMAGLDVREIPLDAPAGTPQPLKDAYDKIARALFVADDIRRNPPTVRPIFEEVVHDFAATFHAAHDAYNAAETLLLNATENDTCAHAEALKMIRRVNDACGHVMLGVVPLEEAASHLRSVPAIDIHALLRAMRRQTSRATLQVQATATQGSRPDRSEREAGAPEPALAEDWSAFRPAKEFWSEKFETYKKFKTWFDKLPADTIRHRHKGQHLYLHAGDWHRYWAERDAKSFDSLDAETVEEYLAGAAARRIERRQQGRRK